MEAKVFDGPIWIQAKQVSRYFKDNIMASYTVRDSETIEHRIVYNWPLTVFEELATNCILHKQYESPNYIGIYIYNDRITFVNHNRPVPPVTIEAMNKETRFDDRQYLNPELKEMFFALDLIESYGSAIRRAKDALKENHSPELQFLPDNDTDDYTMAVVMINEEFAAIREEEQKSSDVTKEIIKEITKEITKEIKKIMKENPTISANEIAEILNVKAEAVRYRIKLMKKSGEITRKGATKAGEWEVIE